jgi:hypothetical protein
VQRMSRKSGKSLARSGLTWFVIFSILMFTPPSLVPALSEESFPLKIWPWIMQYEYTQTRETTDGHTGEGMRKVTKLIPINFSPFFEEQKYFWNTLAANHYEKNKRFWLALTSKDSNKPYPSLYNIVDYHGEYHFSMMFHNRGQARSIRDASDLYVRYHAGSMEMDYIGRFSHRYLNTDAQWIADFPFIDIYYGGYFESFQKDTLVIDRHVYAIDLEEQSFQLLAYLAHSSPPFASDRNRHIFYLDQYHNLTSYEIPYRKVQWKIKVPKLWQRPSDLKDESSYFTLIQPYFAPEWMMFRADTHIGLFSTNDGELIKHVSLNEFHPEMPIALFPPILFGDTLYYFYTPRKAPGISTEDLHLLTIQGRDSPAFNVYRVSSPFPALMEAIAFIPEHSGFWIRVSTEEDKEQVIYYDIP